MVSSFLENQARPDAGDFQHRLMKFDLLLCFCHVLRYSVWPSVFPQEGWASLASRQLRGWLPKEGRAVELAGAAGGLCPREELDTFVSEHRALGWSQLCIRSLVLLTAVL